MAELGEILGIVAMVLGMILLLAFIIRTVIKEYEEAEEQLETSTVLVKFTGDALKLTSIEDTNLNRIKIEVERGGGQTETTVLPDQQLEAYSVYQFNFGEAEKVEVFYKDPEKGWQLVALWRYGWEN